MHISDTYVNVHANRYPRILRPHSKLFPAGFQSMCHWQGMYQVCTNMVSTVWLTSKQYKKCFALQSTSIQPSGKISMKRSQAPYYRTAMIGWWNWAKEGFNFHWFTQSIAAERRLQIFYLLYVISLGKYLVSLMGESLKPRNCFGVMGAFLQNGTAGWLGPKCMIYQPWDRQNTELYYWKPVQCICT